MLFCLKQKTAYELRISDRSSDVCSSDLTGLNRNAGRQTVRHDDRGFGHDIVRKPQVELVRSQGRRDGTTGMLIEDEPTAAFGIGQSIASSLRGRDGGSDAPASSAPAAADFGGDNSSYLDIRSEEHTSELQSLMRISYAVFCLK